jgi:tetratricopeptide (TPR) repeat protein
MEVDAMSLLEAVYTDYSECCEDFKNGIEHLRARSFHQAAECFQLALESVSKSHKYRNTYASYLGISKLMHGDLKAIEFCRRAINNEWKNADVFLNLARAELFCENRLNTVLAIEKGFDIDRYHIGLHVLSKRVGVRNRNAVSFLPRKSFINNFVGRRMRKVKSE